MNAKERIINNLLSKEFDIFILQMKMKELREACFNGDGAEEIAEGIANMLLRDKYAITLVAKVAIFFLSENGEFKQKHEFNDFLKMHLFDNKEDAEREVERLLKEDDDYPQSYKIVLVD